MAASLRRRRQVSTTTARAIRIRRLLEYKNLSLSPP